MPISEVIALSGHIEKLGIVGVLAIACILLGYAAYYLRKALLETHRQLERAKQAFLIVKLAADAAGIKYDLSEVRGLDDLLHRV